MASKSAPAGRNEITGTALAAHLFCTRETLSDYLAKGVIAKLANGKYDQDECRGRVLAYLRDRAAGRTGAAADASLSSERANLAREQREAVAFKNAISRGEYVVVADVRREYGGRIAVLREHILGIPGKIAHQCEMRERAGVEAVMADHLSEALDELAHPAFWDSRRA
jgi:phage terminase Nu1 subunit (DNA packaging protein)